MNTVESITSGAPIMAIYGLNLPHRVLVLSTSLPRIIWKKMFAIVCTVSIVCRCMGRMPMVEANRVLVTPKAMNPSRYTTMF